MDEWAGTSYTEEKLGLSKVGDDWRWPTDRLHQAVAWGERASVNSDALAPAKEVLCRLAEGELAAAVAAGGVERVRQALSEARRCSVAERALAPAQALLRRAAESELSASVDEQGVVRLGMALERARECALDAGLIAAAQTLLSSISNQARGESYAAIAARNAARVGQTYPCPGCPKHYSTAAAKRGFLAHFAKNRTCAAAARAVVSRQPSTPEARRLDGWLKELDRRASSAGGASSSGASRGRGA